MSEKFDFGKMLEEFMAKRTQAPPEHSNFYRKKMNENTILLIQLLLIAQALMKNPRVRDENDLIQIILDADPKKNSLSYHNLHEALGYIAFSVMKISFEELKKNPSSKNISNKEYEYMYSRNFFNELENFYDFLRLQSLAKAELAGEIFTLTGNSSE